MCVHEAAAAAPVDATRGRPVEPPGGSNCTGTKDMSVTGSRNCSRGPHVQRKSPLYRFDWKAKVIMACTIAAAFEVVIVLFMVLYWGQIRWLLRKFPCPCDETYQRSGSVHEPLNRDSVITGVTSASTTHEDFAQTEFDSLTGHHGSHDDNGGSHSDSHGDRHGDGPRGQQDMTRVSTVWKLLPCTKVWDIAN
ncbi:hypothetical protein NP493_2299g00000 [Ridgeia piscesae]|uniref:Uncharacterized protein n=1 Tax=Ridgeia piscesae TaxID=27915 RepID=A0AAD9N424_RIDPI|nr:hypothetical protein NP493_2299g00000 [Ridgeia piscesae]